MYRRDNPVLGRGNSCGEDFKEKDQQPGLNAAVAFELKGSLSWGQLRHAVG